MAEYITGDCHGDFQKVEVFCRRMQTTIEDCMIILGDAGINYCMDHRDTERKKYLAGLPITVFCVYGNHEERPSNISSYRKKKWKNGTVYFEPEYPNLIFAKDGEIYEFSGKKVLVIGGAGSPDKAYRMMAGLPWFEDEQPNESIKNYTEQQIADSRWKVDYVLSHTCPLVYRPEKSLYTLSDPKSIDLSTERWLETLAANLQYERWYFGHYHDNRVYVDAEMLYDAIKLLGLKETLQKQGRPEYRKDEAVIFSTKINGMEVDGYGTIKQVHAYGTKVMDREATYDIYGIKSGGAGAKELFENIAESQLMSAIL